MKYLFEQTVERLNAEREFLSRASNAFTQSPPQIVNVHFNKTLSLLIGCDLIPDDMNEKDNSFRLMNSCDGRCLEVEGDGRHNGAVVTLGYRKDGNSQRWRANLAGRDGSFIIRHMSSMRCLDLDRDGGQKLQLWDAVPWNLNQRWKLG